jgi:hypothetical protein
MSWEDVFLTITDTPDVVTEVVWLFWTAPIVNL